MSVEKSGLHVADYVVFMAMLLVSLGIGFYHSLKGNRERTTSDYLMGNRQMSLLPTTMSLMVSYMSSILLLGYPAEMYGYGAQQWLGIIGAFLGALIAVLCFVPVLYPLELISVNEYLEKRYESAIVKYIGCFCSVFAALLYTSNVYFGPATAIEAVTTFPAWASILIASIVSVIYTTIGGIRGVVWTDVFQAFVMLVGVVAVTAVATVKVDGITKVFEISDSWGRLDIFNFDPDPFKRLSFWTLNVGMASMFIGFYGYFQSGMQRYASLPSIKQAKMCLMLAIPGSILMSSVVVLAGLAVFAYYTDGGCDPFRSGQISNLNQIFPYFVVESFQSVPGFTGLFLASVSAASLSTASSNLNSAAANTWDDLMKHVLPSTKESTATLITKAIVVVFGVIATLMAFALMNMEGTVLQMLMTFSACLTGPLQALFFMGIFIPWINWKGAGVGSLVGFAVGMWISMGQIMMETNLTVLPTPIYNCTQENLNYNSSLPGSQPWHTTSSYDYTTKETVSTVTGINHIYELSYYLIQPLATLVTMIVAAVVSWITGFNNPRDVDPLTIHPCIRQWFKYDIEGKYQIEIKPVEMELFLKQGQNLDSNSAYLD